VLRSFRPDIVLSPSPHDRHPDHGRAHRLVEAASFYAGLAGRAKELGPSPHRPGAVFSYMQHDSFAPSFVVDATAGWEAKLEALRAYRSQLYVGPREGENPAEEAVEKGEGSGPVTKISTREFWLAVEGRARHFGLMINAELGEPFWSRGPLAVSDLLSLLPGGLR
jgi:LmbE family N-acetylglucosaminyl deacetylase